jgi:hypothetical protein
MPVPDQGRMLLSHNFNVSPDRLPVLSREAFTEVFQAGLSVHPMLRCRMVEHPHWTVELLFPTAEFAPAQVGQLCAEALAQQRRQQVGTTAEILVLGGIKTTPPTSDSPDALQPGDWGVDVVETESGDRFLESINWDTTVAQKPAEMVFKVELKGA